MHGTIMLTNRRGRKRRFRGSKPGAREVVVVELNPRTIAASQPHRRDLPEAVRHDQKGECELGRLCLFGRISDDMERAGRMFALDHGRYLATTNPPNGVSGGGRGFGCSGDPNCGQEPEKPPCECAYRKNKYLGALKAVRKDAGADAIEALFMVAVHDRPCSYRRWSHLKWGLVALVRHYGIGGRK